MFAVCMSLGSTVPMALVAFIGTKVGAWTRFCGAVTMFACVWLRAVAMANENLVTFVSLSESVSLRLDGLCR